MVIDCKKRLVEAGMVLAGAVLCLCAASAAQNDGIAWKLKFKDDFNGGKLNPRLWKRIDKGSSDWNRNMSTREDLVTVNGGQVHLHGVKNADTSADPRPVLTGGITTKDLFAVKYGKIEVRCRLEAQKGAWPAIWMMPQHPSGGWPKCGEIDIVERLNFDDFVYQTVHSAWTQAHPDDPPRSGKGKIDPAGWNVFGLEWTPERIAWTVNGRYTHSYSKKGGDPDQFPWTSAFYLMMDMQLGGSWVGAVDESTLPTAMHVDWVRFYEGSRAGRKFTEFERPGKETKTPGQAKGTGRNRL